MAKFKLFLSPITRLEDRWGHQVRIQNRRHLLLLVILADQSKPLSRRELAQLVWPPSQYNYPPDNLRTALLQLKNLLGDNLFIASRSTLALQRDWVELVYPTNFNAPLMPDLPGEWVESKRKLWVKHRFPPITETIQWIADSNPTEAANMMIHSSSTWDFLPTSISLNTHRLVWQALTPGIQADELHAMGIYLATIAGERFSERSAHQLRERLILSGQYSALSRLLIARCQTALTLGSYETAVRIMHDAVISAERSNNTLALGNANMCCSVVESQLHQHESALKFMAAAKHFYEKGGHVFESQALEVIRADSALTLGKYELAANSMQMYVDHRCIHSRFHPWFGLMQVRMALEKSSGTAQTLLGQLSNDPLWGGHSVHIRIHEIAAIAWLKSDLERSALHLAYARRYRNQIGVVASPYELQLTSSIREKINRQISPSTKRKIRRQSAQSITQHPPALG
ncbi:MAG: hypothetical protein KF824_11780 [Fimbriimonadaceae bacterium]|nr:MAG: hypothetical protein KF824_11780 [Fimbriimonadaceae bacterium]